MVADNVKNFEVVLADSRIINANADENRDLFTVLKGGGPNFGIVTRFDLYTKPDYQVWYTFKVYSIDDVDRVTKAAVDVESNMANDDKVGFFLSVTPTALTAGMLHRGWLSARPKAFAPFDGITPLMTAIPETNGTQLSIAKVAAMSGAAYREIGTATIIPDPSLYSKTVGILQDIAARSDITMMFTFQPVASSSVEKSQLAGGNVLNVYPQNQSWLGMIAQWADPAKNEQGRKQIRELISRLKSAAADHGKLIDFDFMNDSNYIQSPLKGYGDANLAKIRDVATKYDPRKVFQTLQNDGFLISKV
jgi:hypothetical protein